MLRRHRINKKTADKQILHTYRELRNERRRNHVMNITLTGTCVLVVLMMAMVLFVPSPAAAMVIAGGGLVFIIGGLALYGGWNSYGTRGASLAFLTLFLLLAIAATFAWDWVISLL